MELHVTRRMSVELRDDEIAAFSAILKLAHDRLRNATDGPQLHGCPLRRQAGLLGPELFRVKNMLESMGERLGIPLPYDADPEQTYPVALS